MRSVQYVALALLMASSAGIHDASAFTVDETTGANSNLSSRFGDPDDKIPFPHVADDGQPSDNFQSQPVGNTGFSFGLTPSNPGNSGPDAFQRAQERMQQ